MVGSEIARLNFIRGRSVASSDQNEGFRVDLELQSDSEATVQLNSNST